MSPKRLPKVPCPNCGEPVKYGSQHCRGSDELNAWWVCEKPLADRCFTAEDEGAT